MSYRPDRSGRLVVRAVHEATPALGALAASARAVDVIPRSVGSRSRKRAVRALQRRLDKLGYVVGARGRYDGRTARAVLAFRKVTGMRRSGERLDRGHAPASPAARARSGSAAPTTAATSRPTSRAR